MSAEIGVVGLAVMGENLILNMESRGFTVAVHNRTASKVHAFVAGRAKGKSIIGCDTLEQLVENLKSPRRVMLMVQAGRPVDELCERLYTLLSPGDIIIDGGNSHFPDSQRRMEEAEKLGFRFIGTGVSGGEEGALKGPSLMPGGSPSAWPFVKDIFQAIAARVDDEPCCDWVGGGGAGHFVKMVHNGIEYGDMQLITEAYHLMRTVLGMSNEAMQAVFDEWNQGDLDSYLIEITRDILAKRDDGSDNAPTANPDAYVVDRILDTAGQKGTGKWTVIEALNQGMPLTLIGEAVFSRCLSAQKSERVAASQVLPGPDPRRPLAEQSDLVQQLVGQDRKLFIDALRDAVFASKLVSYAQGYVLMRSASDEHKWDLNFGGIALMWRGGCIIRSKFLGKIKEAFEANPELQNLLIDPHFCGKVEAAQDGWRRVVAVAAIAGAPAPALSAALGYYDGLRTADLPANLLQAQRDFFGAHTYERTDQPRGSWFHSNWTGRGGSTASSTYNA